MDAQTLPGKGANGHTQSGPTESTPDTAGADAAATERHDAPPAPHKERPAPKRSATPLPAHMSWPSLFRQAAAGSPWGMVTRMAADVSESAPSVWVPQIEVIQRPKAFVVRADLPGLSPDDMQVSIDDGVLNIAGERRQEKREEREGFIRTERSYGTFHRAVPLPAGADNEHVSATFRDGVLEVTLPMTGGGRGRRIPVQP